MAMSDLFYRNLSLLLAFAAACILSACATTDIGSQGALSTQSAVPAQVDPAGDTAAEDLQGIEDEVQTRGAQTQTQIEPDAVALEADAMPQAATSGTAPTEVIEGVAVFPEQRYELEEPLQFETDYDTEINRLREELAASEAELARSRARAAERDTAASQADGAFADSGEPGTDFDDQSSGLSAGTTTAQADAEPDTGFREAGPDLIGKPTVYSIYFGYNEATLERDFEDVVVKHAEFLRDYPDLTVEIQGNCDERGSREYNIALGEQRARSVKRALELLGIDGSRIRTVSFGAEKPIAFGHDEESWRQNRRADIVY